MSARINQKERAKYTQTLHTRRRTQIAIWIADCQKLFLIFFSSPGCMQLQFSLLSKKGLRYLLYPFISLWIVGGRISPSFTSAFSKELSNSLRTKARKKGKRRGNKEIQITFFMSHLLAFFFLPDFTRSRSLHSPWLITQTKAVNWVLWQIFETWAHGRKRQEIKMEIPSCRINDSTHTLTCKNGFCLWDIWNHSFHFLATCPFKIIAIVRFHYDGATPGDMDEKIVWLRWPSRGHTSIILRTQYSNACHPGVGRRAPNITLLVFPF